MLKAVKVVGLNSDTEAALALISDHESSGSKAHLFVIVSCFLDDAFSRARQALSEAEASFWEEGLPLSERLPKCLQTITKSLEGAESVQLLIGCYEVVSLENNVFYLVAKGQDLIARLIRNKEFTDLAAMSGDGQLVSGFLKSGDRVILSTPNIKDFLGEDLSALAELPIDLVEDEVSSKLPQAQVSPLAIVVVEDKVEEAVNQTLEISSQEVMSEKSNFTIPKIPLSRRIVMACLVVFLIVLAALAFFKFRKQSGPSSSGQPSPSQAQSPSPSPEAVSQVKELPLWLDLNLIKTGLSATNLSVSGGKLLILDASKEVLVSVNLSSKAPQLLAGEDKLDKGEFSSINGDAAWVFSEDKGVLKVDTGSQTVQNPIKKDSDWGNISGIFGFAGNAYLLDKGKDQSSGQVWKYVPIVAGYSDKSAYFKPGVNVDLSQFLKLQIDSSVWVLKRGAQVSKYTQGSPDFFSFSGLTKPVKDIKTFFVSDETEKAYFLDTDNNRLLVTDKKGQFIFEYHSDKFQTFSDFIVDEGNKKAYFLSKDKIYQMDLK